MASEQSSQFCPTCGKATLHERWRPSDGWGCLLTIITVGLFLPVWIVLMIVAAFGKFRCQTCGRENRRG